MVTIIGGGIADAILAGAVCRLRIRAHPEMT